MRASAQETIVTRDNLIDGRWQRFDPTAAVAPRSATGEELVGRRNPPGIDVITDLPHLLEIFQVGLGPTGLESVAELQERASQLLLLDLAEDEPSRHRAANESH